MENVCRAFLAHLSRTHPSQPRISRSRRLDTFLFGRLPFLFFFFFLLIPCYLFDLINSLSGTHTLAPVSVTEGLVFFLIWFIPSRFTSVASIPPTTTQFTHFFSTLTNFRYRQLLRNKRPGESNRQRHLPSAISLCEKLQQNRNPQPQTRVNNSDMGKKRG